MKELSFERMEEIEGGNACSIGLGVVAIGWTATIGLFTAGIGSVVAAGLVSGAYLAISEAVC
jgi:hypothetical protein